MSKKSILVAVALYAMGHTATAREVSLSVDSLLSRISTYNADVHSAESSHAAALQGVSVAKSARLPQIKASLDLTYLGDGTILDRDFSHAMRDKLPHFGNTLNVNLYQPVYQGGAINAGIELAGMQSELAAIGVDQQRDASSITALSSYLNLLKMHRLKKVYQENISITEKLIDQMKEHFNQGTALKNDVTRYELRLSSLNYDLSCIDNSISVLNCNLASLLGLGDDVEIIPEAGLENKDPQLLDESYWQIVTRSESDELKAIDKTREITKTSMKLDKATTFPSVGIIIGDQLSGPVTFEIPALNKNYNAWYAGVSIGYNFSSLYTANKKIKQKQLELVHIDDQRTAMTDALGRRVHQAYTDAVQALQMLDTETVNVRLANENYEVVETRFHNDMALLTDMLDASTAKLDAETRLVNARINLLLAYYQLKYISGTLN